MKICSLNCALIALCIFQILATLERQIFDFLSYQWLPICVNFVELIVLIFGLFGTYQNRYLYLAFYTFTTILWIVWNIFVICLYFDVFSFSWDMLSLFTGSLSYWALNGPGCRADFSVSLASPSPPAAAAGVSPHLPHPAWTPRHSQQTGGRALPVATTTHLQPYAARVTTSLSTEGATHLSRDSHTHNSTHDGDVSRDGHVTRRRRSHQDTLLTRNSVRVRIRDCVYSYRHVEVLHASVLAALALVSLPFSICLLCRLRFSATYSNSSKSKALTPGVQIEYRPSRVEPRDTTSTPVPSSATLLHFGRDYRSNSLLPARRHKRRSSSRHSARARRSTRSNRECIRASKMRYPALYSDVTASSADHPAGTHRFTGSDARAGVYGSRNHFINADTSSSDLPVTRRAADFAGEWGRCPPAATHRGPAQCGADDLMYGQTFRAPFRPPSVHSSYSNYHGQRAMLPLSHSSVHDNVDFHC